MTSAYILVTAVLVLGGIIAALGDHLGSKVGKAKLRLFDLRPRQTAVVLTVLTGTLIAASTLGILFTFSKSLREGVFKLDEILQQLRTAQSELERASTEKKAIEQQLAEAKTKQVQVQKRSQEIDDNYNRALAKLRRVSRDAQRLQADVQALTKEREQLRQQKLRLVAEMSKLQAQVKRRDMELGKRQAKIAEQDRILAERQERLQSLEKRFASLEQQRQQLQTEINQRDEQIDRLDQSIALKDRDIRQRESKLQDLEKQLGFLNREVQVLEQYYQNYQDLRERKIALLRGQVLAFGAVRVVEPTLAIEAVDELLRQANRNAWQATRDPNTRPLPGNEPIVRITTAQVQQLAEQLKTGEEYVVRILSAGNYVQGEEEIRVFADVAPNRQVFREGETIATISMDSSNFSEEDIQKRLDYLLSAAQFRARREGILGNIQIEDGRIKTLIQFVEAIQQATERPDEIRVVATENTSVVGPLKLRFVALRRGNVIF
jgi:uncharacterized protein (DUF3084 family)